jgi:hypothetical protein
MDSNVQGSLGNLDALSGLSDLQRYLNNGVAQSGLGDLQKQFDDSFALGDLSSLQRQLSDSIALSSLSNLPKHFSDGLSDTLRGLRQFNDSIALGGLNNLQRQLSDSVALSDLSHWQKQLSDCTALTGLKDLHTILNDRIALDGLGDLPKHFSDSLSVMLSGLADVQKQLSDSVALSNLGDLQMHFDNTGNILGGFKEAQRQLVDGNLLKGITSISPTLDELNRLVREDQNKWATINHTFDHLRNDEIELPIPHLRLPNFEERLGSILDARSDRDGETQKQQFALLASIAEAGGGQNKIMAKMAELQETLVKEALENTRIQKTVLYFAALGSVLALLGLFLK